VDPGIVKAAEGMEELFLEHMMQAMRKTVPESPYGLQNMGTQVYQGMLDSEYAKKAAHSGGYGLADLVIAYMDARGYNAKRGSKAPEPPQGQGKAEAGVKPVTRTGGTDEGGTQRQSGDSEG
jgi:Rod binding domain-containing protein